MFKYLSKTLHVWPACILVGAGLAGCLTWLALSINRDLLPTAERHDPATRATEVNGGQHAALPRQQLSGESARLYLEQTSEGQSLMQAVTAARFGLKSQERGPFGETGGGYLGMSHDQNLNAWFAEDGVTVRPTVSEEERGRSWHMDMRLKAYGYGNELVAAPPIVSHHVKDNRIEYERADCQLPIANCRFERAAIERSAFGSPQTTTNDLSIFQSEIGNRQSAITEWYENRAEGIEQGFTIGARPERKVVVGTDEPLRLVVSLKGDLQAQAKDEGRAIELTDGQGKRALSYSKLTAQDADGKQLATQMEVSTDGREITLVVEDAGARYPIVIDPIVASLERILDPSVDPGYMQVGAQFGDAVAIDGDRAVVGAWKWDADASHPDAGAVYRFSRNGSNWYSLGVTSGSSASNAQCGYSVAISGARIVFGCPGASNTGRVFLQDLSTFTTKELIPSIGSLNAGDQFGASVAIGGNQISIGAPSSIRDGKTNVGAVYHFFADSSSNFTYNGASGPGITVQGAKFGTALAIDGGTTLIGSPGTNQVFVNSPRQVLQANDSAPGDLFGQTIALSGNTAVISAGGNDARGTDAGAAYVFVRDASENWSQQQKLTASDARAGDLFSYNAVAIQGNTIVVGAFFQDAGFSDPNDNRGAAYIFSRSGTIWTEQRRIRVATFDGGAPGNQFGVSVGISRDTVIVGAQHAPASDGTANTGAAYVYRLDCVPPYDAFTYSDRAAICPGGTANFAASYRGGVPTSYQWRKNGLNIPGAANAMYTVQNASASDTGSYDVLVSNSCGNDISRSVTLTVQTFSLNPTSQNFSASGSNGIVNVSSSGNCAWTAVSNASWITITSGASGMGSGTVNFTVAANTSPTQRTGTIAIGGTTFTVTQDGLSCGYSINPISQSVTAASNTGSINVSSPAGCAWTAASNAVWLSITFGANGSGNAVVNYSVAANTGPARTGTLTVAGQTFTVTQASGCNYSLNPTAQTFPASTAAGAVNVTTSAGCAWTTVNNSPSFITITSGASGNGNGTVSYSVAANSSTTSRTGTITIAGQTFTVTQAGLSCSYSIAPSAQSFSATGGTNSVNVTATPGCAWTATSNAPWVNVIGSGTGDGIANYSVATNTGLARTGTLSIAGATFTVNQNGMQVALTTDQVTLNSWTYQGRTYAYVKLSFPDAGYRVANWGQAVRSGTDFSSDAVVEKPPGASVQAVTTTAQIYDLGPLADGNYAFTFKNSGTTVKALIFTVSSATPPANQIDNARQFVKQQYRDFLNREADQAGEDFWTDNITLCSDPARRPLIGQTRQTEAECTLRQRETTSGAFFLSPEFQYTGYYVYRMYQGALGRQPKLSEFIPDAQFVGAGILVNSQLSGAKINQNKADFAAQFVNCTDAAKYRCAEFKGIYDGLNNQQYVDKLFQTTGVNASASDRTALVNGLNGGSETRASVLHKVVDGIVVIGEGNQTFTTSYGQAFYNSESNRAFVQLEYFGYMKRDPDDAGYTFWLGKLDQFGGNFVNAEMVLAFISSPEYRARFGQP